MLSFDQLDMQVSAMMTQAMNSTKLTKAQPNLELKAQILEVP